MIIFVEIIALLATILFGFSIYFHYRNNKVCEFKIYLNNRVYNRCIEFLLLPGTENISDSEFEERIQKHEEMVDIWHSINAIPYEKMLFSFKPLQTKYWLTQEQINFLNS